MADGRVSFGLRWFFLLLLAEVLLFGLIFFLRQGEARRADERPAGFSRVQTLNLQSLINAKGYGCPTVPMLRYAQRASHGVVIIATCSLADGARRSFEIDFKGHVRPL
jgi:hypothetical protein